MKIKTKKEIIEFNQYFKTLQDLKEFIKKNNKFVNVDNLEKDVEMVYNKLTNFDTSVKSSILGWIVVKEFNFKHTRPNNINFWLERGFGVEEFNEYNYGKTTNNQFNTYKKNKIILPINENNENNFKYGKFSYKSFGQPKCNLCKYELDITPSLGRYNINGCKNETCETRKNNEIDSIRQLGFLPFEVYLNKNKRLNINTKVSKEYWLLKGYTYTESLVEIEKIRGELVNVNINTFEYYKLTTDMCDDDIKKTIVTPSNINFWINKGFSKNESKEIVTKNQINAAKHVNFEKRLLPSNFEYWINKGFSSEESKKKVSEHQSTFTLEKCIIKYGEEDGKKRFTERQNKWLNSLLMNGNMVIGYSKISQELFYKLLETYDVNDRDKIYFATHNKEFKLDKGEGGVWLYDFTDIKNKKIIEFHGDVFHGNPKKYNSVDNPHPFRKYITAQEMWDKDKRKLDIAIENGFDVMVIWDSEYRWGNKQEIINKCITFLNKK